MADQAREQRRAQLSAIAQGGKAGGDAYQQAISSTTTQRDQALAQAADRAGVANAPAAFLQRQAGIVSQPADTAVPMLNTARNALQGYLGTMNAAQQPYMASVGQSKGLLASLAAKQNTRSESAAQAAAAKQYKTLLAEARSEESAARTSADRTNKSVYATVADDARRAQNPDVADTMNSLLVKSRSLQEALNILEGNSEDEDLNKAVGAMHPEIKNELRDRMLQFYDPERWVMTNDSPRNRYAQQIQASQ